MLFKKSKNLKVFFISLFLELKGGRYLEVGDERCTHLVVEENSVKELPTSSKKLYVVKQEVSSSCLEVGPVCFHSIQQIHTIVPKHSHLRTL